MSVSDPSRDIPLPRSWPNHIKVGVVHAISIAHAAVVCSRGWAVNSSIERARLASELRASENEVSLLKEEIRIKDGRTGKMDPRKRPRYSPSDRMAILELKSARGWTIAETARIFQVEAETISSWMARLEFELPDKSKKQKKLRASSKRRKPRQHPLLKVGDLERKKASVDVLLTLPIVERPLSSRTSWSQEWLTIKLTWGSGMG